jgi:site-specific recombinase XerD
VLYRDLRVVQALLGHSDLTSTLWYLQDNLTTVDIVTREQAKDGIEKHLEFYNSKGTETIQ